MSGGFPKGYHAVKEKSPNTSAHFQHVHDLLLNPATALVDFPPILTSHLCISLFFLRLLSVLCPAHSSLTYRYSLELAINHKPTAMPEEEKQEKKEEDKVEKKEEDKVILRVDMHCEACKIRVTKVLKEIAGAENINVDLSEQKVTVNGKIDAQKVFETVKKKCGKRTLLLFPEVPKEEGKKDEKEEDKPQQDESIPPIITLELRVKMHCSGCAKDIKKRLLKMDGVVEVNEDLASGKVIIKGKGLDGEKVCAKLRKAGKYCDVIPPPEPPKAEEKKEDADSKPESKEEKKDEKKDEENNSENKVELKKYVYPPHHSIIVEYMYPPQLFSDENPNACNIM